MHKFEIIMLIDYYLLKRVVVIVILTCWTCCGRAQDSCQAICSASHWRPQSPDLKSIWGSKYTNSNTQIYNFKHTIYQMTFYKWLHHEKASQCLWPIFVKLPCCCRKSYSPNTNMVSSPLQRFSLGPKTAFHLNTQCVMLEPNTVIYWWSVLVKRKGWKPPTNGNQLEFLAGFWFLI